MRRRRRYPDAEIVFVGPTKIVRIVRGRSANPPLPRSLSRGRSSLRDRLRASAALWLEDGIVIDPDSRLTQLGLISVCDEDRYFFFESRAYGGDGDRAVCPMLAARWAREMFGVNDARPYIAPLPVDRSACGNHREPGRRRKSGQADR